MRSSSFESPKSYLYVHNLKNSKTALLRYVISIQNPPFYIINCQKVQFFCKPLYRDRVVFFEVPISCLWNLMITFYKGPIFNKHLILKILHGSTWRMIFHTCDLKRRTQEQFPKISSANRQHISLVQI